MERLFVCLEQATSHAPLLSETDCDKLIDLTEGLLSALRKRRLGNSCALKGSQLAALPTESKLRQITCWNTSHIDACCLALTCRAMRNLMYAEFPKNVHGFRFQSSFGGDVAVTVGRLQWSIALGCDLGAEMFAQAAAQNQVDALEWLYACNCPWDGGAFAWAAYHGAMEALQYLHAQGAPLDHVAASSAAWSGRLDVLQWFHARDAPFDADSVCQAAARGGHKEVLRWARDHWGPHFTFDAATCEQAALGEDEAKARSILEWLRQEGALWDRETTHNAMRNGHIEVVKWLIEEKTLHSAMDRLQSWQLRMVIVEVPWDTEACHGAACNNDLDLLMWLRDRDAPWDEQVTREAIAIADGKPVPNIELLAWSRAYGCPIEPELTLLLLDWLLLHSMLYSLLKPCAVKIRSTHSTHKLASGAQAEFHRGTFLQAAIATAETAAGGTALCTGCQLQGLRMQEASDGLNYCEGCWAVKLGKTKLNSVRVDEMIEKFKPQWPGKDYKLLTKNCQTFAIELTEKLLPGTKIPAEYTRFAGSSNQSRNTSAPPMMRFGGR
ncbi:unnamed protein product [Polarella glacialis]|uniref:PPPDE domain-containing protein n=1 Tax=Polarella glacialis TaxID=89957 RepID=A0A813DLR5_POLGL|nr:unnamed protein product [Polarella glacialis]